MQFHYLFLTILFVYYVKIRGKSLVTASNFDPQTKELIYNVNSKRPLHVTNDKFLSFTFDPDVIHKVVNCCESWNTTINMVNALKPAYLRIAGPHSDKYIFGGSFHYQNSNNMPSSDNQNVSVNPYYVTNLQWIQLNEFLIQLGVDPIICLNRPVKSSYGIWDLSNIIEMLTFSYKNNFALNWQLGYELDKLSVDEIKNINSDISRLRKVLDAFPIYQNSIILGPDIISLEDEQFVKHYLADSVNLDIITFQFDSSNLNQNETQEILPISENKIDNLLHLKDGISLPLSRNAPKKVIWLAEHGVKSNVADFEDALQLLKNLGSAAKAGISVYLHEPHLFSIYEPTSEFWVSLLFKALVSKTVLDIKLINSNVTRSHAFCHCTKISDKPEEGVIHPDVLYEPGAITIYGVNTKLESERLSFRLLGYKGDQTAHLYVLTPTSKDQFSKTMFNRQPLDLSPDGDLPLFMPKIKESARYFIIPPSSAFFIIFPYAKSRACISQQTIDDFQIKTKISPADEEDQQTSVITDTLMNAVEDDFNNDMTYVSYPKRNQHKISDWIPILEGDKINFDVKFDSDPRNVKYITYSDESWLSSFPEKLKEVYRDEKINEGLNIGPNKQESSSSKLNKYKILGQAILGKRDMIQTQGVSFNSNNGIQLDNFSPRRSTSDENNHFKKNFAHKRTYRSVDTDNDIDLKFDEHQNLLFLNSDELSDKTDITNNKIDIQLQDNEIHDEIQQPNTTPFFILENNKLLKDDKQPKSINLNSVSGELTENDQYLQDEDLPSSALTSIIAFVLDKLWQISPFNYLSKIDSSEEQELINDFNLLSIPRKIPNKLEKLSSIIEKQRKKRSIDLESAKLTGINLNEDSTIIRESRGIPDSLTEINNLNSKNIHSVKYFEEDEKILKPTSPFSRKPDSKIKSLNQDSRQFKKSIHKDITGKSKESSSINDNNTYLITEYNDETSINSHSNFKLNSNENFSKSKVTLTSTDANIPVQVEIKNINILENSTEYSLNKSESSGILTSVTDADEIGIKSSVNLNTSPLQNALLNDTIIKTKNKFCSENKTDSEIVVGHLSNSTSKTEYMPGTDNISIIKPNLLGKEKQVKIGMPQLKSNAQYHYSYKHAGNEKNNLHPALSNTHHITIADQISYQKSKKDISEKLLDDNLNSEIDKQFTELFASRANPESDISTNVKKIHIVPPNEILSKSNHPVIEDGDAVLAVGPKSTSLNLHAREQILKEKILAHIDELKKQIESRYQQNRAAKNRKTESIPTLKPSEFSKQKSDLVLPLTRKKKLIKQTEIKPITPVSAVDHKGRKLNEITTARNHLYQQAIEDLQTKIKKLQNRNLKESRDDEIIPEVQSANKNIANYRARRDIIDDASVKAKVVYDNLAHSFHDFNMWFADKLDNVASNLRRTRRAIPTSEIDSLVLREDSDELEHEIEQQRKQKRDLSDQIQSAKQKLTDKLKEIRQEREKKFQSIRNEIKNKISPTKEDRKIKTNNKQNSLRHKREVKELSFNNENNNVINPKFDNRYRRSLIDNQLSDGSNDLLSEIDYYNKNKYLKKKFNNFDKKNLEVMNKMFGVNPGDDVKKITKNSRSKQNDDNVRLENLNFVNNENKVEKNLVQDVTDEKEKPFDIDETHELDISMIKSNPSIRTDSRNSFSAKPDVVSSYPVCNSVEINIWEFFFCRFKEMWRYFYNIMKK